jgi:hypothetical protein
MIVYRAQDRVAATAELLGGICEKFRAIERRTAPDHAGIQDLLIDFGELEAGVADALCPEFDTASPELRALRHAAHCLGHVFHRTWRDVECAVWLRRLGDTLADVRMMVLPSRIRIAVAEGYAHYGLYPETYSEAAVEYMRDAQARHVVCVGIRSIGASLSAVVCGTLEELGVKTRSYTVRPHGHPFDRMLSVAGVLAEEWRAAGDSHFVIVDEGPGLSGSSFACVARKLAEIGVPEERIAVFPSWDAPAKDFVNQNAREIWPQHRKYFANFEDVWLDRGRLKHPLSSGALRDVSAGAWRALVYGGEADYPASQPRHEARKYLAGPGVILKFAGLGKYGERKLDMARALSVAGFVPAVFGLTAGLLVREFVAGEPLTARDASRALLDRMAAYLAFRGREFPAERVLSFDEMCGMVVANVAEGLPEMSPGLVARLRSHQAAVESRPAIAIDGRMMPHEWLRTARGVLKTDAVDHHADHFFPGRADVAWDLAGACVEFRLEARAAESFIERYRMYSGDPAPDDVLDYYRIAYLAFRLGYTKMAADATSGTGDQQRFQDLQSMYTRALRGALARSPQAKLVHR